MPAKVLCHDFLFAESFFIEINLHKRKWLFNCSYNPHKNNIIKHLELISRSLDTFSTKYDSIILLGDCNVCIDDETMKAFCSSNCLKSFIKQQTCFKNPEKPSSIDLILTNRLRSFQSLCVIVTGLSDFQKMTISALKLTFEGFHQTLLPEISRKVIMKSF